MQKDWLEDLVVRETMKLIQDDAVIDKIVQLVMDVQNQENTTIPLLEKQLREVNKKLDNLMKAIEDGLYTRTMKERLEALEIQKDELTAKIADEKLKKPSFNEDFIRFWLMKFRKFDISGNHLKRLLEFLIFVNRAAKKPLTVQVSSMVSGFTIASIHLLLLCAVPGLTRLQTAQISSLFFMQIIARNPKLA